MALPEPWREESPALASYVSGVFSRQGDSGGGHPNQVVTAVNLTGGRAIGLPAHFDWRDDHAHAILRFQKRKAGSVAACERHNERKKEAYKSNPNIDVERSKENYHLVAPPWYTYKKEINHKTGAAGCRVRRDSVMLVETLITASIPLSST